MATRTFEIINITYSGDTAALFYHAKSLKKNWLGPKNYTIVLEDNNEKIKKWCEKHIVPILNDWDIKIINSPRMIALDGWFKQDLLKLWAAGQSEKDVVIILDSKNIFIRPFSPFEMYQNDALRVQLYHNDFLNEDDTKRYKSACKILDVDFDLIDKSYCITPFFWEVKLVKELITILNEKDLSILSENLVRNADIYPYTCYLYWCYAHDKISYVPMTGPVQTGQYGGIGEELTLNESDFYNLLNSAIKNNCPIFSFHRFHCVPNNFKNLSSTLHQLGILEIRDPFKGADDKDFYISTFKKSLKYVRPVVQEYIRPKWKNTYNINFNNKKYEINRLVVYGCSYVNGDETADLDFLPNMTLEEINLEKKKLGPYDFHAKYIGNLSNEQYFKYRKKQHENVWAGKLAKKLNIEYVNRGKSGNSMQGICYDLDIDFLEGKILDTDLVIVGLTSDSRWMYITDIGQVFTPLLGYEKFWPNKESYKNFIENFSNPNNLIYQYQHHLRYLDMLSKNSEFLLTAQFMHCTLKDYISFSKNNLSKEVVNMAEKISLENICILDNELCFNRLVDWNKDTHGFFHPLDHVQETMAERIYQRLLRSM